MSPRTPQQFEEIRQEKKQLILDAAMKLFAQEGFHATSISAIAKEVGIAKGLLYNYFESKEDLLTEIFRQGIDKGWSYFDPNHDGILTRDEFFYFIRQNFKTIKDNPEYWRLYSMLSFQPTVLKLVEEYFKDTQSNYGAMLLDFFTKHGCNDPENELLLFGSMMKGVTVMYLSTPDIYPMEKAEEAIITFYEERLKTKA